MCGGLVRTSCSGLQTDCMVVVPAPVVRLPDSHVCALWPWAAGCHPYNINEQNGLKVAGSGHGML